MMGMNVNEKRGTHEFAVSDVALRGLSMPVDLYLISAVGRILITALRVSEPGTQVFLPHRSVPKHIS